MKDKCQYCESEMDDLDENGKPFCDCPEAKVDYYEHALLDLVHENEAYVYLPDIMKLLDRYYAGLLG